VSLALNLLQCSNIYRLDELNPSFDRCVYQNFDSFFLVKLWLANFPVNRNFLSGKSNQWVNIKNGSGFPLKMLVIKVFVSNLRSSFCYMMFSLIWPSALLIFKLWNFLIYGSLWKYFHLAGNQAPHWGKKRKISASEANLEVVCGGERLNFPTIFGTVIS